MELSPSGRLVSGFGSGGIAALPFPSIPWIAPVVGGKLMIAPGSQVLGDPHGLLRLNPDGTFDHGFQVTEAEGFLYASPPAVLPDGRLMVHASWQKDGDDRQSGVVRLTADGAIRSRLTALNGRSAPIPPFEDPNYRFNYTGSIAVLTDGEQWSR